MRSSQVAREKGAADTVRDPRGFAVKFYTDDGNCDLVGNNTPIFFIRDPLKFPDLIHSQKRDPYTNFQEPDNIWDFFSHSPKATHQFVWLFGDRGNPSTFRHMDGFGSHTFQWMAAYRFNPVRPDESVAVRRLSKTRDRSTDARPQPGELFNGRRPRASNESRDLADDLALHGVATEEHSAHGDRHDENGRKRNQRIVGQRRAHARDVVLRPSVERFLHYRPQPPRCQQVVATGASGSFVAGQCVVSDCSQGAAARAAAVSPNGTTRSRTPG